MRPLLALALAILLVPTAQAGVTERALPSGWKQPSNLAFAQDGALWVTLEGTWAVGRFDLATGNATLIPLSPGKHGDSDNLWALRIAPDGGVWTASTSAAHRIDPATGQDQAFAFPAPAELSGDIFLAKDGTAWVALVDEETIVHVDPRDGSVKPVSIPESFAPFGPIDFAQSANGTVYLTGTYGDTYARFDPATGQITPGPSGIVKGPVGVADQSGSLWIAEMGLSGVSRVDPATGAHDRYPTTPSSYYPISGPSGIVAAPDGSIWFAEHFADRIARLDPTARTLVEYEVPSAPGTNLQRIIEGPDGAMWFAEYSKDKVGSATYSNETPLISSKLIVHVQAGGAAPLDVPAASYVVGNVDSNLTTQSAGDQHRVTATSAASGDHLILLSQKQGKTTVGRYVEVIVDPATKPSPAPSTILAIAVTVALALALRRRR